jgi:two-component system nitrogen regulation sensor histidine kinase GlnL
MSTQGVLFLGLTAVVAALVGGLTYAVLRLFDMARAGGGGRGKADQRAAFVTDALGEALRDLKTEEQALKARAEASERLSGEIIASMTSGLLVVDEAGMVRSLNPAALRMLGMPPTPQEGPFREVLTGAEPLADVVEECLGSGEAIVRRTVSLSGPARATHLGVTVSPILEGGTHGAICLFTDLTAVMELEDQLRLKDSLARLGELTAGIAHEFRNGLATIHGYSRLLELERLPAEYQPFVETIRSETVALGEIVTQFLNFAKPADVLMTPVATRAIVERAADDIRADVAARGGELIVGGEFAEVDGDEVLLRQAFSNLCRNALEACSAARVVPSIAVTGAVDAAARLLRVTVSDNGPGVDPAVIPNMFQPFFTTKAKGTGLGLALVQKIVVTHNGRVSVANAEGGGARLSVVLPLADRGVKSVSPR